MKDKLKRVSALMLALMMCILVVPVVLKAAEEDVYWDVYENAYDVVYPQTDNVIIKHFWSSGCSFRRTWNSDEYGIVMSNDMRNAVNTVLNQVKDEYKYVYLGYGYNGGAMFQIFASNDLFYGFNGGIVIPDTTNINSIYCICAYAGGGKEFNSSVSISELGNRACWGNGVGGYHDIMTATCNGQNFCCVNAYCSSLNFIYANVPVYSTYESDMLINGKSSISDCSKLTLADSTFRSNFDKFWGKLTNVNVFSSGYTPLDYDNCGYDTEAKLTQFTVAPEVDNPNYISNYALVLNYAFNEPAVTMLSDNGRLHVNYTIEARVKEVNSNYVYPLVRLKSYNHLYEVARSGHITVRPETFLSTAKIMNTSEVSTTDTALYENIMQALSGTSSSEWVNNTKVKSSKIGLDVGVGGDGTGANSWGITGSVSKGKSSSSTLEVETYEFVDFVITAEAYGTNGVSQTNTGKGVVNLAKGSNESYTTKGNSLDTLTPDLNTYSSNSNYYTYDTNSNTYNYYNSVTNETKNVGETPYVSLGDIIVNVESGGGSGSMVQNNNVTFPESIKIFIESSLASEGLPEVIINDDDLTDSGLREDLSDGFGLIDDSDTLENNDGFIAAVSDFYSGIDPHFKDLIMFGVASTVGVAILRMIFKR